jgi:hypothetical protein
MYLPAKGMSQVAHILFVDSPVGAGFSFSRKPEGYQVGDVSSSLQLHDFLIKWFSDHPKYLRSPFYMGGDSYAGKLVPFIAYIISQGTELTVFFEKKVETLGLCIKMMHTSFFYYEVTGLRTKVYKLKDHIIWRHGPANRKSIQRNSMHLASY